MASGQRRSMAPSQRPSAQSVPASSAPRRAPEKLPDYQPPTYPPNDSALRALAGLARQYPTAKLKKHLGESSDDLNAIAGDINERLTEKRESTRKRKARRERNGVNEEEANQKENEELEQLAAKVDGLTKRMESNVRKAIDGQQYVLNVDQALVELNENVVNHAYQASSIHATNTQRTRHATTQSTEVEGQSVPPTADTNLEPTQQPASPPLLLPESFKSRLQSKSDAYQSLSHRRRYAEHNAYKGFKRTVHDAQYPSESAPPLPHSSTWFPRSEGSPAPGVIQTADDDDDDDIAISRERISTRCPLTTTELKEPLSSTKCPHVYERSTIMEFLARNKRQGFVRCPVPGCEQTLTTRDLRTDPALVRRIRRLQSLKEARAQRGYNSDEDEDGEQGDASMAQEIGSDSGEDIDEVERRATQPVKEEWLRSTAGVQEADEDMADE